MPLFATLKGIYEGAKGAFKIIGGIKDYFAKKKRKKEVDRDFGINTDFYSTDWPDPDSGLHKKDRKD